MIKKIQKFMFNCRFFFVVLFLLTLSFSVFADTNVEQNNGQIFVNYSFKTPIVKKIEVDKDVYDQVIISGSPGSGSLGEPCLPAGRAYILLPYNTKYTTIKVTGEKMYLGSGFRIVPCSEPIPLSKVSSVSFPIPDETVYNSECLFPGRLFTQVGIYSFRGYDILVLMLHHVQYIPATGEIFYYNEMTIHVETEKDETNMFFRGLPSDKREVVKKVDNPEIVDTYNLKNIQPLPVLEQKYELMILTSDELKDDFKQLKEFHDAKGIHTVVRTLSDVGSSDPKDIRDYIRNVYNDSGIEYVLIGGDIDIIPSQRLYYGEYQGYEHHGPSDLYYACLDGPFNFDDDEYWGEPHDGENGGDVDLMAEVYVGRACVDTQQEVGFFIDKTIAYLNSDKFYLSDVLWVGEYTGFGGDANWGGNYKDEMIDGCSNHGYTTMGIPSTGYSIVTLYDREGTWPKSEIISRINNNIHIVNHVGHADYDYNMKMYIEDVDALTNNKYCFVYSQGCMSGGFDNPEGYDCIAEHFTVKTCHGAVAGIWNARYGWGSYSHTDSPSQRFDREFWDAVFGENISCISKANQDSKEDNLYRINENRMRWCYYELNLFGDPVLAFQSSIKIKVLGGLLGSIRIVVENIGKKDISNVKCRIVVEGGLFGFINVSKVSVIPVIAIGDATIVKTDKFICGLGLLDITVTANSQDAILVTKTVEGFVFLSFIKIC